MIVQPDFPDHWKTQMLIGLTQDKASPLMVIRLWGHCQLRKTHIFNDLTPNALKSICRWGDEPARLEAILLECGFIKKNGSQIIVHQWDEVNAFLVHNWVNGAKGGRPKKPKDNPTETQAQPIDKIREDKTLPSGAEKSLKPLGKPQRAVSPKAWDFIKLWKSRHLEFFGVPFKEDGEFDGIAADALISLGGYTIESLMDIAEKAWKNPEGFWSKFASSISGFSKRFNEIRKEVGGLKIKPRVNADGSEQSLYDSYGNPK